METEFIAGLECLVHRPAAAKGILVLLHGYAMDASDLTPLAQALSVPLIVCVPRGPRVVQRGGRAWWPIDELQREAELRQGPRDLFREKPPYRPELRVTIANLVEAFRTRERKTQVFLAGFSQGGMLCTDAALHIPMMLNGLALFSTSCIAMDEWRERQAAIRGLPVLVCHGSDDQDLAIAAGERLRDFLTDGGAKVAWRPFQGRHEMPFTVWRELKRFVVGNLT